MLKTHNYYINKNTPSITLKNRINGFYNKKTEKGCPNTFIITYIFIIIYWITMLLVYIINR